MLKFNLGLWFFKHMANLILVLKLTYLNFISQLEYSNRSREKFKAVCTSYTPFSNAGKHITENGHYKE